MEDSFSYSFEGRIMHHYWSYALLEVWEATLRFSRENLTICSSAHRPLNPSILYDKANFKTPKGVKSFQRNKSSSCLYNQVFQNLRSNKFARFCPPTSFAGSGMQIIFRLNNLIHTNPHILTTVSVPQQLKMQIPTRRHYFSRPIYIWERAVTLGTIISSPVSMSFLINYEEIKSKNKNPTIP